MNSKLIDKETTQNINEKKRIFRWMIKYKRSKYSRFLNTNNIFNNFYQIYNCKCK